MSHDLDIDALNGFIDESNDSLQGIEADFIALENDPGNIDIINKIFRPVHSLKGNSGFFGLTNINKFSHRLENLLDATRKGEILVNKQIIDILLNGVEFLQQMLDRAQQDPTDVAYRPDEKDFLKELESFQAPQAFGSVQSVINLEKHINDLMDLGLSIHDHPIIAGLLDKIEKANLEIAKIIEEKKNEGPDSLYSPDYNYWLNDADYTDQIDQLGEASGLLSQNTPLSKELLLSFSQALDEIAKGLKQSKKKIKELDELFSMRNFLDDALMVSNGEYNTTCRHLINAVIECFEAKPKKSSSRLGEILVEQNLVTEAQINDALGQQKKIGELLVEKGIIKEDDLKAALKIQDKRALDAHIKESKTVEKSKTIRIDQSKLDSFANSVGGLYINLDSINFLKKQLEQTQADFTIISRFDSTINSLDEQIEKLHEDIMNIRRVPVKSLFQRFPKVVRQLSATLNKDIKFNLLGEETVIDKDLLEKIENPLVHILRNSLDHGIELPAERTAVGKPPQGNLTVRASADENNVYIVIEDDGKGIDPRKMKEIALKKQFMSPEELASLSDKDLVNLIFKPGFSSAEKISDVSGRGVGMDVVMAGLNECNGSILVDSETGKGTKVSFTIPLTKTLVTMDAMIAECGAETYAIPSDDITTVIETQNIIPLLAESNCIAYDDSILRLVELNTFYYPKAQSALENESPKVVVVSTKHGLGLLVDRIISHQKIVAKDFRDGYKQLKKVEGIAGYTIMGNEDIILITDVKKIAERAEQ